MTPRQLLDNLIQDMLDPEKTIKGNDALGIVVAVLDGIVPKEKWVVFRESPGHGTNEEGVFDTKEEALAFAKKIRPLIESPLSPTIWVAKRG